MIDAGARGPGRWIAALVMGVGVSAPIRAQEVPGIALDSVTARIAVETRKIIDETGIPAISIALVRDGDVAWAGAFGLANVGAGVGATPDTYFSTGSTFKFVTATAIMQLVERGRTTLDTPLNDVVGPEHAIDGADDVTLRHLLSHHSGLTGPVNTVPLWSRMAPITPEVLLSRTTRTGPPGTTYRYCNECYAMLGYVITTLTGHSYDDYVADNILAPLEVPVRRPSVPSPAVVEHLALPYNLVNNAPVPVEQVRYDVFAAGDVYLRAVDMGRFLAMQLGGGRYRDRRLLTERSVQEMRRQQFPDQAYGLGTGLATLDGHDLIQHSGAIPGFNSISIGEPATGLGVYIMANAGQAAKAIAPLARLTMALLWGEHPDPLPGFASAQHVRVHVDPAVYDDYVGEYELTPTFILAVTREGDGLYVQATGQPRFELYPESETDFFLGVVEASVTFGRDEAGGPVTHLILHQGGHRRAERRR